MDAIFHRTSIRKYQETPVEAEKIETLLRAAMAAPLRRNQQPWEFYVVRNKEKIKELSEASPYAAVPRERRWSLFPATERLPGADVCRD